MNTAECKMFLDFFVANVEQEYPVTKKVLAAVPEGQKSYKPDDKSKTANELAWHIATADIWFADSILSGSFSMSEDEVAAPATIAEMVQWYEKNITDRIARLKAAPVDSFTKPVSFFGIMELPAVMYFNVMTHHTVHHRGQLSAYLRAMGGKVPGIYGGSADEPFEMTAQA